MKILSWSRTVLLSTTVSDSKGKRRPTWTFIKSESVFRRVYLVKWNIRFSVIQEWKILKKNSQTLILTGTSSLIYKSYDTDTVRPYYREYCVGKLYPASWVILIPVFTKETEVFVKNLFFTMHVCALFTCRSPAYVPLVPWRPYSKYSLVLCLKFPWSQ